MSRLQPFKLLQFTDSAADRQDSVRGRIETRPAEEKGMDRMRAALGATPEESNTIAESLGHVDYRYYAERLTDTLAQAGERRAAAENEQRLADVLAARRVHSRRVAEHVLEAINERVQQLGGTEAEPRAAGRGRARNR
jgi:hypothetical protein